MKASDIIKRLEELMLESGEDPEVLGQSHGCCSHGHPIESIDFDLIDDAANIVIHV